MLLCSRGRTLKTGRDKAVCCGTTWRCFFEGHASAEETDRVRMWVEAQDREARVKRKKIKEARSIRNLRQDSAIGSTKSPRKLTKDGPQGHNLFGSSASHLAINKQREL